jgi:hypothetical protein
LCDALLDTVSVAAGAILRSWIKVYWLQQQPMTTVTTVELKAQATRFYSKLDEGAFFQWLETLPCVWKFEGQGDTLYIRIIKRKVDEHALRELLALFQRYRIDMKQLGVFDRPEFAEWFHNKEAYWYESVFVS